LNNKADRTVSHLPLNVDTMQLCLKLSPQIYITTCITDYHLFILYFISYCIQGVNSFILWLNIKANTLLDIQPELSISIIHLNSASISFINSMLSCYWYQCKCLWDLCGSWVMWSYI